MRSVALKSLEDNPGEYVRIAEGGETVLIFDRDRVVAELTPPRGARSAFDANPALAEAVRMGWITPAAETSEVPPPRSPVAPIDQLLKELDEDRGER